MDIAITIVIQNFDLKVKPMRSITFVYQFDVG